MCSGWFQNKPDHHGRPISQHGTPSITSLGVRWKIGGLGTVTRGSVWRAQGYVGLLGVNQHQHLCCTHNGWWDGAPNGETTCGSRGATAAVGGGGERERGEGRGRITEEGRARVGHGLPGALQQAAEGRIDDLWVEAERRGTDVMFEVCGSA